MGLLREGMRLEHKTLRKKRDSVALLRKMGLIELIGLNGLIG